MDVCLIENRNMCVQIVGGWSPLPVLHRLTYTLMIAMMIMNLVSTVIPEAEIIEKCIEHWRCTDPDQTLLAPFPVAGASLTRWPRASIN